MHYNHYTPLHPTLFQYGSHRIWTFVVTAIGNPGNANDEPHYRHANEHGNPGTNCFAQFLHIHIYNPLLNPYLVLSFTTTTTQPNHPIWPVIIWLFDRLPTMDFDHVIWPSVLTKCHQFWPWVLTHTTYPILTTHNPKQPTTPFHDTRLIDRFNPVGWLIGFSAWFRLVRTVKPSIFFSAIIQVFNNYYYIIAKISKKSIYFFSSVCFTPILWGFPCFAGLASRDKNTVETRRK